MRGSFSAILLLIGLIFVQPIWGQALTCAQALADESVTQIKNNRDLREAFLGHTVTVNSELGPLQIGIVDVDFPGVAEAISKLLVRSISDARETNNKPGHLPDHLVDDVIQQYISPEKVKTFWRYHGHRFAVMNAKGEIIGTLLLGIDKDVLIYLNRWTNNVPSADYPGVKPEGYHHMMNLSVLHELRRTKVASLMLDTVTRNFRHLFNGKGIWMRADPPWHDKLVGLEFKHDPSMDFFLPAEAEKTLGLSHKRYNAQFKCSCHRSHPENPSNLILRDQKMESQKLQYFSFTRDFEPKSSKQKTNQRMVDVLIVGGGVSGTSFALKLRELNPALNVLIISRSPNFALSGQGHLYPMTGMEDFRFPGQDSIQPQKIQGVIFPGEVEKALIENQKKLNIWQDESIENVTNTGKIVLKSGVEISARAVVVATGMTAVQSDTVDSFAQNHVENFLDFSRALAQLPYIQKSKGSWGTVAILGDGAAGQAIAKRLKNDSYGIAKEVILIGEKTSRETLLNVTYLQNKFQIEVRDQAGQVRQYSADKVVTSLGFNNSDSRKLAAMLKTQWVIGAGAFEGSAPPMVRQVESLSDQARKLNSQLSRGLQ